VSAAGEGGRGAGGLYGGVLLRPWGGGGDVEGAGHGGSSTPLTLSPPSLPPYSFVSFI